MWRPLGGGALMNGVSVLPYKTPESSRLLPPLEDTARRWLPVNYVACGPHQASNLLVPPEL